MTTQDELIAELPPVSGPEALEISRRRAGLSQAEAAELAGVSLYRYKKWEAGEDLEAPYPAVEPLEPFEWCRLQRRRRAWSIDELAAESGFAPKWIHRVERGEARSARPLEEWWRNRIELDWHRDRRTD